LFLTPTMNKKCFSEVSTVSLWTNVQLLF
jgi:hypothetical protein